MADIIPFSEAAPRARARRAERLTVADLIWFAAVCVWPISMSLFFGMSAIEAARMLWGRR